MARTLLFALLLFFCVSDALSPNAPKYDFDNEISVNFSFGSAVTIVDVEESEMCKPTGVETVIYTDGKTEPAPEKKKPVTKTQKKKTGKKTQPKKA